MSLKMFLFTLTKDIIFDISCVFDKDENLHTFFRFGRMKKKNTGTYPSVGVAQINAALLRNPNNFKIRS